MSFAERNVLSAFEFAQKIVQAKDIQEFIRMQTEFVQSQIQVLSEQVKDLGETATKVAMDSLKDLGERATKTAKSVKDLGETATKAAMKNVKDLSETATKTAMESVKDSARAPRRRITGVDERLRGSGLPQQDRRPPSTAAGCRSTAA